MPPRAVRRLVIAPVVVAVDAVVLMLSPFLLLVAAVLSPALGGARPLRMAMIVVAFTARHAQALLGLLALWVRSGFGRRLASDAMQAAHYDVMQRFVAGIHRTIVRYARVTVITDESEAACRALEQRGLPLVVLSRHAGEGDSLLVFHELLCRHGRRPRVVMHEALRLDPLIDVLGERVPNRFVDPRGGDTEIEIADMARELDGSSALVIFPEGANFSEARRLRGIERLERAGHAQEAGVARAMVHVSAPRPGGALAAIAAAPTADVLIMGHVGFPTGVREVWRRLPERQTIEVKLWHEPRHELPSEHDARIEWLFQRWHRLDAWVDERQRARAQTPRRSQRG